MWIRSNAFLTPGIIHISLCKVKNDMSIFNVLCYVESQYKVVNKYFAHHTEIDRGETDQNLELEKAPHISPSYI